jgi:hypothetical protein
MKNVKLMPLLLAFGHPLHAAVLPPPSFGAEGAWHVPGGGRAVVVDPEKPVMTDLVVPGLGEKEVAAGGNWRGILEVDVLGTPDGSRGVVQVEAVDPPTGEVLVRGERVTVEGRAPQAGWAMISSSGHGGEEAAKAFDGNPATIWHSEYGAEQAKPPHWIGLAFSAPRSLEGVSLLPRQEGSLNGAPREWRVEVRGAGGDWRKVAEGTRNGGAGEDGRKAIEVKFEEPQEVEAFRFVIVSDLSGGGFGSAAELKPLGVTLEAPEPPVAADARVWLELSSEWLKKLEGKSFGVRLTAWDGRVVIGEPRWCRIPSEPGAGLFGRSNGGLGPDHLGAGLLGFTAMSEHRQTVLPVIDVREGGAAAAAGLRRGDAIVSVAGVPLPVNDLAPGWTWFRQSHEAVLGRASETALSGGAKTLEIGVIRDGGLVTLPVALGRTRPFSTMNPVDDPEAAVMLKEMLQWIVRNQKDDGSWSGDIKRTTLAALALLATGEEEHEACVRKAVDWSLARFDKPEKHGNLGFWGGSYMGILYSEWHLRTGDERVLPHLELMRDWAFDGRLPSAWEVPALGHGPNELPYGQKALVAPACHLLVFEALAMRCGMEDKLWDMLMPYMEMAWSDPKEGGHGSLGYNRSYKDLEEFWSRSGLFAMACHLRDERPDMRDAMVRIMVDRHPWFRNSHAYGEPGGGLGLLGIQLAAPDAYASVIRDYAWWFSLAWEPGYGLRFTQPHMGAPYMGEDDLFNVVYALVLQSPKRNLHLTGKPH